MEIARHQKRAIWLQDCEAYEEALKEWLFVREVNPFEPLIDYTVGLHCLLLDDVSGALVAFHSAIEKGRDQALLADDNGLDRRNDRVEGSGERTLDEEKIHYVCALSARADCFDIKGNSNAAKDDREEINDLGGNSCCNLLERAQVHARRRFFSIAEGLYGECLELEPDNVHAALGLVGPHQPGVVCWVFIPFN